MTKKVPNELPENIELFLDVPVGVTVQLGSCQLTMREVLQLGPGSVVPLDKAADAAVEILVNDKLVARGEVVVLENRLGINIKEMVGAN